MHQLFLYIIDFIFPPKEEEITIRNISNEDFYIKYNKVIENEFNYIKSIYSYKDPLIRELIWQIKYKKNVKAIEIAGYSLYKKIIEDKYKGKILIPIPISKERRKERGYNQCELIINEILKYDTAEIFNKDFNILYRIKNIEKQTFKNRNDRLINTKDIFQAKNNGNEKIPLILIDDVSTTGSTMNEASLALKKAGYVNIEYLTIAH